MEGTFEGSDWSLAWALEVAMGGHVTWCRAIHGCCGCCQPPPPGDAVAILEGGVGFLLPHEQPQPEWPACCRSRRSVGLHIVPTAKAMALWALRLSQWLFSIVWSVCRRRGLPMVPPCCEPCRSWARLTAHSRGLSLAFELV